LDEWGLERVTLVGADMGGQPALAFAAKHPDRVNKLVVMNCLAFPEEDTSWEIRLLRHYGWNRLVLRHLPRLVFKRAEWTFLPSGVKLPQDMRQDLWGAFQKEDVREFVIRLCSGYQGTLSQLPPLYSTIGSPALILWAEWDGHFPPIHAQKLKDTLPRAFLHVLPGERHWMSWYKADSIGSLIADFLGSSVQS
jgi:pimeloyl-ACP methyl ester carboxylesterase